MNPIPIFDGHNDTLLNLHLPERGQDRSFFIESDIGHIDLPRAKKGNLGGGFFAMFTPNKLAGKTADSFPKTASYHIPLPPRIPHNYALDMVLGMTALAYKIEAQSAGRVKIVRTAQEIIECLNEGTFAMLLHIEGTEAISKDLDELYVLYAAGLRSLGPVWSRNNAFANGVPFAFPASPDIGTGLTKAGKRLLKACNELGILFDLSHLNEAGFWDVANLSNAPLVATHSNAYTLCASTRNLSDKQLDAVGASGGVVGVNYYVAFLREDGQNNADTPLDVIAAHIDYIASRIGIDHVALGSDFDGAQMPTALKDVTGLPKLMAALRARGFDDSALRKIAHENWTRVLRETLKD